MGLWKIMTLQKEKKFFFLEKMKTCLLSFSGNPLPRLTWYKSGSLIDETYDILSNGTVRNEITFHSIERSFLRTKLTCEASNTNLTRPTSTTVNVDMNCKFYKNTRMAEPWSWPRPQPNVMAFFIILKILINKKVRRSERPKEVLLSNWGFPLLSIFS